MQQLPAFSTLSAEIQNLKLRVKKPVGRPGKSTTPEIVLPLKTSTETTTPTAK